MGRLENLLGALSLTVSDRAVGPGLAAGMSATDQAALVTLHAFPGRTTSWLGRVLGLTSSGSTRLVDRLVAAGWVRRAAGDDSRQRRLSLTAEGAARSEQLQEARQAMLTECVAPLDAHDRVQLEPVLERLVSSLTTSHLSALTTCRLCDRGACREKDVACPLDHTIPEGFGDE